MDGRADNTNRSSLINVLQPQVPTVDSEGGDFLSRAAHFWINYLVTSFRALRFHMRCGRLQTNRLRPVPAQERPGIDRE